MKTILLACLCSVLILSACEKNGDSDAPRQIDGAFSGTFFRTGMDTVTVQLNFEDDKFTGISERDKYPALCAGTYNIDGSSINFSDTCTWTADFDWTLILNGTYTISEDDGELKIFRENNSIRDEYKLRRVQR